MSKKIKKGDNIIVITGKDKGKTGEVFLIDRKNRKPSQDQPGGIEQIETFINISNIALIDPSDNKPCRVSFKIQSKKKIRVASRSGKEI